MHGTRGSYVHGCRCEECRRANREYANSRALYGYSSSFVDAQAAREHVGMLARAGMGRREIARRAGVADSVVSLLLGHSHTKPAKKVSRTTQDRLLSVQPGTVAPGALVPILGTQRRLQALVAIGWTQTYLAMRLGWLVSNLTGVVNGRRTHVVQSTATAVRALYSELEMTPGPSQRARTHAASRGWPPPMAFDDEQIDNTNRSPDRWARQRIRRTA